MDETAAREIYRSLVPGEYMVLVAPDGFVLPDAGLESPRGIKSGRPARPPVSQPGPVPAGVPFRIPPPVDEEAADGASPVNGSAGESGPEGESAPAVEATPEPAPDQADPPAQDTPPEEPPLGGASAPSSETGGGA